MKYFFDTEFIENGKTIDLISIGICDENDRSLYRQNSECDFTKASDWVWRNVFPHLAHFDMSGHRTVSGCDDECCWATRVEIGMDILRFCEPEKYGEPEFWGYFADYDWVVFCQLFGTMMQLPKGYPMYCRDLKQLLDSVGNPRFQKDDAPHHALSDAQWIRDTFKSIQQAPVEKAQEAPMRPTKSGTSTKRMVGAPTSSNRH